ncbi:MAG TPA: beta-ketoacyl-ACP synthase II [Anaerolineae bacterium]|nr:beta-ketoacyl-ACP synthase II [Anaerolineae bacterium]
MNSLHRVVITGMGAITPLGLDVESSWKSVVAGVSGVGPITLFDSSALQVHIAAEAKGFDAANFMDVKDARRRDRYTQFAIAACREAMQQSGLKIENSLSDDVGVYVGTGVGGLGTYFESVKTVLSEGPRRINPFAIPMIIDDGASGAIAIEYGARGLNFAPVTACAAGSDAIGMAFRAIQRGEATAVIAGGAEAAIVLVGMAAFDRTGACSRRNDDPTHASRPFDKNREGLVFGEGAAIFAVEALDFALARGAAPLAEIVGYGATSDAFHLTAPSEDGSGAARAIGKALRDANLGAADIDWICAHGTATQLNDKMETLAIKSAFGERAYEIPISGTKSMHGHIMGATGAINVVWCIKAIQDGIIPPTLNYDTPDPELDLDYTPNQARRHTVDVAMTNAFGFGGHNSVLIIKRYRE